MAFYVAYYRVSTKQQEKSGLGLDAQKTIVEYYAKIDNIEIIAEFMEAESGKNAENRVELNKAIDLCIKNSYHLIVAKLDRLSRSVKDTFTIIEKLNGRLNSCDIPTVNGQLDTLVVSVFAAMAQRERELISIRTKLALQAKKARGFRLGKTENFSDNKRRLAANTKKELAYDEKVWKTAYNYIKLFRYEISESGLKVTYQAIADRLNASEQKTLKGKFFTPMQVYRLVKRYENTQIKRYSNPRELTIANTVE